MVTSPDRRTFRGLLQTLPAALMFLAVCLPVTLPGALRSAEADEPPSKEDARPAATPAFPGSRLAFTGSAGFKDLGSLGQEDFRFDLKVTNPLQEAVTIRRGNLLLCHRGGWLVPLDPEAIDGSFFRGEIKLKPGETRVVAGQKYRATTPATHAILSLEASDGVAQVSIPIQREGFAKPSACAPLHPLGVGVVGPLEALPFSDGKVSLLLIGQHQVLGGAKPTDVVTTVSVGSDKGSMDPVTWKGLDAKGDLRALWPFAKRIQVFDGFAAGRVRLTSQAVVDGRKVSFTSSWAVQAVKPLVVRAPVLGTWQLSNGPGQTDVHDHYVSPQYRYAYDMVVLKGGRTHAGDPHSNDAYFAWNRSIRAVADGEVVDVCDRERDNPGYRGSLSTCYNNRVVIKHANGLYTAYLHIRQRSVAQGLHLGSVVRAGQVIARVGNSGDSSEPHLHFMAFRIDKAGRMVSVPVGFSNAWHDAKATLGVVGVPLGGKIYHFRNK